MFLTETVEKSEQIQPKLSRRQFLYGASAAAALAGASVVLGKLSLPSAETVKPSLVVEAATSIEEVTIAQLQAGMVAGSLTAGSIVNMYEARINTLDRSGPTLNSILQVNLTRARSPANSTSSASPARSSDPCTESPYS